MTEKNYTLENFLTTKSATGASFSPNGRQVAFLSNETGTNQLYLISDSNNAKKIEQLTAYDDPVSFASFSPVKNEILFGKSERGSEKTQFFIIDNISKSIRSITDDSGAIYKFGGWSSDGKCITYSSNQRNNTDFDIYVMEIEKGTPRCVFDDGGWCDSLGFSPSGRKILVRKRHTFQSHDFYSIDIEKGEGELLTTDEQKGVLGYPQWLPDESGFYFTNNNMRDFDGLCFFDVKTKKHRYVFTPEMDVEGISLSYNGKLLAVTTNEEGNRKLTIYEADTLQPLNNQSFPEGLISNPRWSADDRYLLFSFSCSTKNANIWVWSKNENTCRQITYAPCSIPEDVFVKPTLLHFPSFDGLQVPAFLFFPKTNNELSKKIPVIVHIHGGPEDQYRPGFNSLLQYFVYCGYAVVAPNIRGSSGYGKKYLTLDDREKRMDSVADLQYLHEYLKRDSRIDSKKISLMGTSYGGYMTLAGLAFQPNLWAAGIDIVGFSNLVSFLENTSSWRRMMREAEYGYLNKDKKLLESISPFNFIENIQAPLLIIHGANDPRVPLSESEQIAEKLKKNHKKVELLIYPDEGHGLKKLRNRINAYTKIVAFLDSLSDQ